MVQVRGVFPLHDFLHHVSSIEQMIPRHKKQLILCQNLDPQRPECHVFIGNYRKCSLVTLVVQNQISHSNKDVKEVFGTFVVSHIIKASICRQWLKVTGMMVPVMLEIHVKAIRSVLKILQRILVPDKISILKKKIVPQRVYQMHTVDLGHHYFSIVDIIIINGSTLWNRRKNSIIIEGRYTHRCGKIIGVLVGSKKQDSGGIQSPGLGRTVEIHNELRLSIIGNHDNDRSSSSTSICNLFCQRFEFFLGILVEIEIRLECFLIGCRFFLRWEVDKAIGFFVSKIETITSFPASSFAEFMYMMGPPLPHNSNTMIGSYGVLWGSSICKNDSNGFAIYKCILH
mmetsp:Transcript_18308/g.32251  ORF Transcript_18308/g.32251 Transcript_18308/m.32251 type:complete len:342 (+) Transcript_18308:1244-2269(+)